jgi:hypothetical protein
MSNDLTQVVNPEGQSETRTGNIKRAEDRAIFDKAVVSFGITEVPDDLASVVDT